MQPEDDVPNIQDMLSSYKPMDGNYVYRMIAPVFDWLSRARTKTKFEIAQREVMERAIRMEASILEHFGEYAGGPKYITVEEAWRQACRQREFVRECCARMAEGADGEINALSEAIREIDVSENVRVIPDYSRRAPVDEV